MTGEYPQPSWWQRVLQRIPASRPGAWLFSHSLHYLDHVLLRLSRGRLSVPGVLAGLPIVVLTATGARSGMPHTLPLVGIPDGDEVILIASNWGRRRHPAWYHNLRANPEAALSIQGRPGTYVAREAEANERASYWGKATDLYIGFEVYRRRAKGREIPIIVMTPKVG